MFGFAEHLLQSWNVTGPRFAIESGGLLRAFGEIARRFADALLDHGAFAVGAPQLDRGPVDCLLDRRELLLQRAQDIRAFFEVALLDEKRVDFDGKRLPVE